MSSTEIWTDDEINIIKQHYPQEGGKIIRRLPRHDSVPSIHSKVSKLGIKFQPEHLLSCTCLKCGIKLTKENWNRFKKKKNYHICKDCYSSYYRKPRRTSMKKWRKLYPERHRINHWLYGSGSGGGFLNRGQGFCLICGDIDPLPLCIHHVFGKKGKARISLCSNCHWKRKANNTKIHQKLILKAIEGGILFESN